MANALAFVGGGLLEGFGKGLATQAIQTGKEKRERALADLGHRRDLERDKANLAGQGDLLEKRFELEAGRPAKPASPLGKLGADEAAGLVDPETAAARRVKLTTTGPLVKIENQAQTIDSKLLDMDLETISGTRDSVKAGEDFLPRLEVIVQGLESGNVETGRWQEATLPIRQWAQSAGWTDDPSLGQQEAVLAAISYMIPRMRVVGSGQTSDVEIRLFSQATAQYSNTPQGNILIARTMMQLQGRNKELLAAQRTWLRDNRTLEGFDADAEIGPMFPKVAGQEEADKLPSGTVFIYTPNGHFMVKQ